jgi:hypothetical protein
LKRNLLLTSLHLTNLAIKRIRIKLGQPAKLPLDQNSS